MHDEPIWENGQVVGLTTSGGKGARTGLTLAFGLIDIANGEAMADTCNRELEIEIAAKFYSAKALKQNPYDPNGERMRA